MLLSCNIRAKCFKIYIEIKFNINGNIKTCKLNNIIYRSSRFLDRFYHKILQTTSNSRNVHEYKFDK